MDTKKDVEQVAEQDGLRLEVMVLRRQAAERALADATRALQVARQGEAQVVAAIRLKYALNENDAIRQPGGVIVRAPVEATSAPQLVRNGTDG